MRAEPGFYESVVKCMAPWLARVVDIRNAALTNATDAKRQDQKAWMRTYGHMVGIADLVDDD